MDVQEVQLHRNRIAPACMCIVCKPFKVTTPSRLRLARPYLEYLQPYLEVSLQSRDINKTSKIGR